MLFFRNKRRWKLYLYLNNQCIKKIYIDENEIPNKQIYVINVWFKKRFFGSNLVKTIIHPTRIIYANEKKRETHWEFDFEQGVDS